MSQRAVERALGKLITDEAFRVHFFREPDRACLCAGLELLADELDALLRVPAAELARLGAIIDDRICRLHVPECEERP